MARIALPIIALALSVGVSAQRVRPAQQLAASPQKSIAEIAAGLSSDDIAARFEASASLRAVTKSTMTPELAKAISDGIRRCNSEIDTPLFLQSRGISGEDFNAYYNALLNAALLSDDPILIPSLIESVGHGAGRPVFEHLASYGRPAADALLSSIEAHDTRDTEFASMALVALTTISQKVADVSPQWRRRAGLIASAHLSGRWPPTTVMFAIDVLVSLKDADGLALVSRIANASSGEDIGLDLMVPNVPLKFPPFLEVRQHAKAAMAVTGASSAGADGSGVRTTGR